MRLGLNCGYWGATPVDHVAMAQEADRLGFHSVWTAEAYGSDAVSPLVWLAAKTERINVGTAILQMTARVPAMTAMTAATIDVLTGGRMLLGIGASGPQVVEGWHGVPYGKPVTRAREYIEILRRIWRRDAPLEFHGEHYDIPCAGGSGLGKPLKLILHPHRPSIPIYLAAIGPKNVSLAAEVADGWLPILFSPQRMDVYREWLEEGFAKAAQPKDLSTFDIAPSVSVVIGDDVDLCRQMSSPSSPSTLAAWALATRTSTSISRAGMAMRPPLTRSRTIISPVARPRHRMPSPMPSSMRSPSVVPGNASLNGLPIGRLAGLRR